MASSLTIAPSLGHSVVSAQGMPGGYDAIDDRAAWAVGRQEGAVEAGAYKVTQRGAGANMTVDVASNAGHVLVKGDTVSFQGLYTVRPHPSVANLDVAAAHATLPRVDSVVVQVDDAAHDASGNTRARVMVLTGTPTSGATLDNRDGAPTLPDSALRLADVLAPAASSSVTDANIRDRRPVAAGAVFTGVHDTGDVTVSSVHPTFAEVDAANFKRGFECSGAPLLFTFQSSSFVGASGALYLTLLVDGNNVAGSGGYLAIYQSTSRGPVGFTFPYTPAAGFHTFAVAAARATANATIGGASTTPATFSVHEMLGARIGA